MRTYIMNNGLTPELQARLFTTAINGLIKAPESWAQGRVYCLPGTRLELRSASPAISPAKGLQKKIAEYLGMEPEEAEWLFSDQRDFADLYAFFKVKCNFRSHTLAERRDRVSLGASCYRELYASPGEYPRLEVVAGRYIKGENE